MTGPHVRSQKKEKLPHYYEENELDTYFADNRIEIPETENEGFSFKKLWAFTGPGFLMSIAYLDPGNIESDLQSGTIGQYRLLWVLFGATILGLVMQSLATKLGVVTGLHLAEMCYRQYKRVPRILLWIMVEIAVIGSDMQEVIGTSIAIYLLSNKAIPLWGGCLITIFDTFTFLFLDRYGLRKLEMFFVFLISVMGITFGYEYIISAPPQAEVVKGLFFPWCTNCDSKVLLQAVGVIGAVIMPHNLYLHSALVKSRKVDRKDISKLKEAKKYFFMESAFALFCSFIINIFVVSVFGYGLFEKKNNQLLDQCQNNSFMYEKATEVFPNNDEFIDSDIYKGGIFLGCAYGTAAMYIWALGILAAGQSSTMTGTYSGQFAMEGFLNIRWAKWKRILFTRSIAMIPTFCTAFFSTLEQLTSMNDFLNAVMMLQLPFAVIPTIAFTSNPKIMGQFVNGIFFKAVSLMFLSLVFLINSTYVLSKISNLDLTVKVIPLLLVAISFYVGFCAYLILHLYVSLGNWEDHGIIRNFVIVPIPNKI